MNQLIATHVNPFVDILLQQHVLPAIVTYVNDTYQIALTVDELMHLASPQPVEEPTAVTTIALPTKCVWTSNHGKSGGKVCGKPTVNGTEYCSTCVKKKTVQKKLAAPTPTTTKQKTNIDLHLDDESG